MTPPFLRIQERALVMEKINKTFIEYKGEKYELVFNLNVMEEIQDEYETVEKWGGLVAASAEPKAKDIKYGFKVMLNEGIDIYNETHANDDGFIKRDFLTDKQVGRIISEIGLAEVTNKLEQTVVDSTKSDEKNL